MPAAAHTRNVRLPLIGLLLGSVSACSSPAPMDPLPDDASPGTYRVTLDLADGEREAVVFIPESYDSGSSTPLVMNFHGFGGVAADHMEWADLRSQATASGAILVYPQGSLLDGSPHWNPTPGGEDNKSTADDFGFVDSLLALIGESYPYDPARVSAVGYSNGGMMALGLACRRSDLVASAGSVSGSMLDDSCETTRPVSVITLHGTQDAVIPYEGGTGYIAAMDILEYWTTINGAQAADPVTLSDGGTTIQHWAHEGGTNGTAVHHYRVEGGDHIWFDFEADGRSANDRIWEFLTAHSLDGRL